MRDLDRNEVLVVGRIILDPPLTPREQSFQIDGIDILGSEDDLERNNRYIINLSINDELSEKETMVKFPNLRDFYSENIFRAKDQTFYYLQYSQSPFYLLNGKILMKYLYGKPADNRWMQGQSLQTYKETLEYILFPIRAYIDIKSKEQAVYVGSIKVKRSETNKILSVTLIDEYEEALEDFKKNFGERPLGKSMMKMLEE